MAAHTTRKSTPRAKQATLARRQARATKYARRDLDRATLDLARELNARVTY